MNHNRVWMDIDLDAVRANVDAMFDHMRPDCRMMAVIKADAYGHGAREIAAFLESDERIFGYAVATADEAYELRRRQVAKPILILGYTFPEEYPAMVRLGIRPSIFSYEAAFAFDRAASQAGRIAPVHIKIDTGMSRIGFQVNEEDLAQAARIAQLSHLKMEGIFTHFARADERDKSHAYAQAELFQEAISRLEKAGVHFEIRHCSNSASIMELPDLNMDMVRAGITLYGLWPSEEMDPSFPLSPVMSLGSHISHIKTLTDGRCISYGGTYQVKGRAKIATIPVGYADGYARSLSNKGYVLIQGRRAPIVGRICMDQFMVDISAFDHIAVGEKVTLLGTDQTEKICLEELGRLSGRFNYEFACLLGNRRIPKVFHQGGQVVSVREDLR